MVRSAWQSRIFIHNLATRLRRSASTEGFREKPASGIHPGVILWVREDFVAAFEVRSVVSGKGNRDPVP